MHRCFPYVLATVRIDDHLISKLQSLRKGCFYLDMFAAALFYADDMAILAPSIKGLTALLKVCEEYCLEWDICLNSKKTKILYFGRTVESPHDIFLNGKVIEWVLKWSYLGVILKSGKVYNCSVIEQIRKFF